MKEQYRTVVLLVLIALAVSFIIWTRQADNSALLQGLPLTK